MQCSVLLSVIKICCSATAMECCVLVLSVQYFLLLCATSWFFVYRYTISFSCCLVVLFMTIVPRSGVVVWLVLSNHMSW